MQLLPKKLSWDMAQDRWASILNVLIKNPLVNGIQLNDVSLTIGNNSINHLLSRRPQGYLITGMHGAFSQIYDNPSQTPDLTLVLNASVATTVDIYVY